MCGSQLVDVACREDMTLQEVLDMLTENAQFQMKRPGVTTTTADGAQKTLYLHNPAAIEKATRKNLAMTLKDLGIADGQVLNVTDPTSPAPLKLQVRLEGAAAAGGAAMREE